MFESGSNMLFSLGKGHSLEKLKGLEMWRLSLIGSMRQTRLLHSTTAYDKTGHAPSYQGWTGQPRRRKQSVSNLQWSKAKSQSSEREVFNSHPMVAPVWFNAYSIRTSASRGSHNRPEWSEEAGLVSRVEYRASYMLDRHFTAELPKL